VFTSRYNSTKIIVTTRKQCVRARDVYESGKTSTLARMRSQYRNFTLRTPAFSSNDDMLYYYFLEVYYIRFCRYDLLSRIVFVSNLLLIGIRLGLIK
jgi:hypothetical protein